MWPAVVIVHAPSLDDGWGIVERRERVYVHALISQAPVKRFNERNVHWLPGRNEIELYAPTIGRSPAVSYF